MFFTGNNTCTNIFNDTPVVVVTCPIFYPDFSFNGEFEVTEGMQRAFEQEGYFIVRLILYKSNCSGFFKSDNQKLSI